MKTALFKGITISVSYENNVNGNFMYNAAEVKLLKVKNKCIQDDRVIADCTVYSSSGSLNEL